MSNSTAYVQRMQRLPGIKMTKKSMKRMNTTKLTPAKDITHLKLQVQNCPILVNTHAKLSSLGKKENLKHHVSSQ